MAATEGVTKDWTWAACLPRVEAQALVAFRCEPGLELAEAGERIWLRGGSSRPELDLALRQVPGLERFQILASGLLKPWGGRVPAGRLPSVDWAPLLRALPVQLPRLAAPARPSRTVALQLVRSFAQEPATLLRTSLSAWRDYAAQAPGIRLQRLRFAASSEGQVLIRGRPLPPLPGRRYCERDGVSVPCGFGWSPPVRGAVVRRLCAVQEGSVLLLQEEGSYIEVAGEQWVAASRHGARASEERLEDGTFLGQGS